MTQLHYSFTDGCGGVAHCHACNAHVFVDFCVVTQQTAIFWDPGVGPMSPKIRTRARFLYNVPNCQVSSFYI